MAKRSLLSRCPSYIFLKIFPLCNYTLLPTTVKMMETFLETILWKPFQLFRRILNDAASTAKAPSLQCWFHLGKQVRIIWSKIRKVWGWSSAVTVLYIFLRNPWPKTTGVLEHCCTGKTVYFPFFGISASDSIPKVTKDVSIQFFIHSFTSCSTFCKLHLRISVNYTNEFRQPF
jgi:hypothetical protein